MVLHFDAAASTSKVKGGPRHLQLLLLASLVAVEARVLAEASVHPAQTLQDKDKTLQTGLQAQLQPPYHSGDAAVASSHFCREGVSSTLTMRDADSATRSTREGHHGKDDMGRGWADMGRG